MGTAEKKRRREISRELQGYSFVFNGVAYPLSASKSASKMLVEFSLPLFEALPSYSFAIALGVLSWNLGLLDPEERPRRIEEFVAATIPDEGDARANVRRLIELMLSRKAEHYAEEPLYFVRNTAGGDAPRRPADAPAEEEAATPGGPSA